MAKVSFDGVNKLIICDSGVTELNVQTDLYSEWKNWAVESDNLKYLPAFRTIGGDPLTGSAKLADTYFLLNGWKIRPYEGNHRLVITGNLFTEDGSNPFVSTVGSYNVLITTVVTSDAKLLETGVSGLTVEESNTLSELSVNTNLIQLAVNFIKAIQSGKQEIKDNQFIFYDEDNETELMRFNLYDRQGNATTDNVFKRERVV